MPDLNGIFKQAQGAADQAVRLGIRIVGAGVDVGRGLLSRGPSEDTKVEATPAAKPSTRKPPTRPRSRAAKKPATPRRSPAPRRATSTRSSPAEPSPTELAEAGAGRQPAPLGSTEPVTSTTGSES